MELKERLSLATQIYNNMHQIVNDIEGKLYIMDTYNKLISDDDTLLKNIFSNESNFELYNSRFSSVSTPPIIIVDHDIIEASNCVSDSFILYILNKNTNELERPVIVVSSRIFIQYDILLLEFVIAHEIGHYRLSHTDNDRNILTELEADFYAYDTLGTEAFVGGYNSFMNYLTEYCPKTDLEELDKRIKFILKNKGIKSY